MSGVIYLIEMSHNGKRAYVILFPNFEHSDKFIYDTVPLKVFTKLFKESHQNFVELISTFSVRTTAGTNQLWISGYHGKIWKSKQRKAVDGSIAFYTNSI